MSGGALLGSLLLSTAALPGCAGEEPLDPATIDLGAYAGFDDGRAWTWRDDEGADPVSEQLLHGQYGTGGITLRRGLRWEEATDAGGLGLVWEDGIALRGWSVGDVAGDTSALLAATGTAEGPVGDAGCTLARSNVVATWYATWDDAIVLECPNLSLAFALGFGLVRFEAETVTLDLVAPY